MESSAEAGSLERDSDMDEKWYAGKIIDLVGNGHSFEDAQRIVEEVCAKLNRQKVNVQIMNPQMNYKYYEGWK